MSVQFGFIMQVHCATSRPLLARFMDVVTPLFVDDDTRLVRNTSVQFGLCAAALRDFSAAVSLIYGRNNKSVVDNDI